MRPSAHQVTAFSTEQNPGVLHAAPNGTITKREGVIGDQVIALGAADNS
jgi:hypothetical protein